MTRIVLLLLLATAPLSGQSRHILFITIDGVRPEDLFGGADPVVMADPRLAGISDTAAFRARWWRPIAEERRRAVMPFLWDTLVAAGVLYGQGQNVRVTNGRNFSGPGYTELFTGAARGDVTSNDDRRYAHRTVFEIVRAASAGATAVAAFTSWTTQARLTATTAGTFVSQGPFEPLPAELRDDPRLVRLAQIESRTRHDDASLRYDASTHELAFAWLVRFRPTLLHISYGEPDVDAHARRYDRYLASSTTSAGCLGGSGTRPYPPSSSPPTTAAAPPPRTGPTTARACPTPPAGGSSPPAPASPRAAW